MTAVQWTNQASVINQRNMYKNGKWLYDKNNTHGCTDKVWCERKAHQLWGHCPHCSEGCGGVHVNGACWHTAVASTPDCIHFCTQWGWPPPPRPERLQFSALGEKRVLYKKGPFKGSHSTRCQGGFNESADRHRKYNFCLLFKEGREKVEKRLHQQQRGRRRWDQVMFYGSSEVFRSWFNLEA